MRKARSMGLAAVLAVALPTLLAGVFTNGGFESGTFEGWQTPDVYPLQFLNGGLQGTPPFSGASILRVPEAGEEYPKNNSVVVTAAGPEQGIDPNLGPDASLRFPKYGIAAARINSDARRGHGNTIRQQTTVTGMDVDPSDGKIHFRFAFAPVVEAGPHPASAQPYFYIAVRNLSRGGATIYENFNFSEEPNVPWKAAGAWRYTDWRLADIAPGPGALNVGDTVEIEVTAAGCPTGGHASYVYVDGFASFLGGLSVVAAADKPSVRPGEILTYSILWENRGVDATNVAVRMAMPAQTAFVKTNNESCLHSGGELLCAFSRVPSGMSDKFHVAVMVDPAAAGSVVNGNYGITSDDFGALLGPELRVPVVTEVTDLEITTVAPEFVEVGQPFSYQLRILNEGPGTAPMVSVKDVLPAGVRLLSVSASQGGCVGVETLTCSLGTLEPFVQATVTLDVEADFAGNLLNTATVTGAFEEIHEVDNYSPHSLVASPRAVASSDTAICDDDVITLSRSGGKECSWQPTAGLKLADTCSPIASPEQTTTYSLTVYSNGIASRNEASVTVSVYPAPAVPAILLPEGGKTQFCAGESVMLTATLGESYLWSNGATTQSIVVTESGDYRVRVWDENGCSAVSDPTPIVVFDAPPAAVVPHGSTALCPGGRLTLSSATYATAYLWSTGEKGRSIEVTEPGLYFVTVFDEKGCSTTSEPIAVTPGKATPFAVKALGPTRFCKGGSVELDAGPAASYLWSTGATTRTIVASNPGDYFVSVTETSGCQATSQPISVVVDIPVQPVIQTSGPTDICKGETVRLTASLAKSYLWSTGEKNRSIDVILAGEYSVTVVDENGCSAGSDLIVVRYKNCAD